MDTPGNSWADREECAVSSALFSSVWQVQDKNNSIESAVIAITNFERICLASSEAATQCGHYISTTGLSLYTYTDKANLPEDLQGSLGRLWKLKNKTSYNKKQIDLNYPEEMELYPDPNSKDKNHFGIRPMEPVRPETFRQVSTLWD